MKSDRLIEYELGEVCSRLSSGKGISAKLVNKQGSFPVFGGNGLRGFTEHNNFEGDCVIIGRQGAFCGNVRYFSGKAYMTEHAVVLCSNEKSSTRYLSYLLSTMNLGQLSGQSAQPGLSVKTLSQQLVRLPPINDQCIIAATLSVLDDKISNNAKLNNHLEQIARAIYSDFQENDEGSLKPLAEIAVINTETYSTNENWHYVDYLDTGNITDGRVEAIQRIYPFSEKLPSRARRKIKPKDIVYSTVRPIQRHFGIIVNPSENMLVSTGFAVIRSVQPFVCNEYIYLHMTSETTIAHLQKLAEQSVSTYPSIKPTDIGMYEIFVPSYKDGQCISELLAPLFELMASNNEESVRLSALRDALLPRLMSGELSVADLTAK